MTTAVAIDWDQWRADYDRMTFKQHRDFNAQIAEQFPVQQQWHQEGVWEFLLRSLPLRVVELGGWDGSLAAAMLPQFPKIKSWVNYDITPNVPQVCDDERYHKVSLIDWPWKVAVKADALVASHVFEHMKLSEVAETVRLWQVDSIYADVPIGSRQDWAGYEGTHIIDAGADEFIATVEAQGFEAVNEFEYGETWRNGQTEALGVVVYFDRA